MAAALEYLADSAVEIDASGNGEDIRYNEDDAMNALMVFMHVVNNVAIHKYEDEGTPVKRSLPHHIKQAKDLRLWFMRMVGVDPHKYFGSPFPYDPNIMPPLH